MRTASMAGSAPTTSSDPASASCSFPATRSSIADHLVAGRGDGRRGGEALFDHLGDRRPGCRRAVRVRLQHSRLLRGGGCGLGHPGSRHHPAEATIPSSCRASGWCPGRRQSRPRAPLPRVLHVGGGADDHGAANCRSRPLNPDVTGDNTANAMQQALGTQLRPGAGQPRPDGLSRPGEAGPADRAAGMTR